MGAKYTKIPTDTFEKIVMNAGIICRNFDLATKEASNQIAATTGGLTVTCVPTFADFGDDIDNCPKNTLELKKITGYDCTISGTMVTVDKAGTKMLLGAADVDEAGKITPRMTLEVGDFNDVWFISDYSDVNTGAGAGFIAVHLLNALNTSGFSLKTADKGKGQFAFTLTGHTSIADQETVPFEVYVEKEASETPYIVLDKHSINVEEEGTVKLGYEVNPEGSTVTFASSATGKATVASDGTVTGVSAGSAIITASITESGVTYSDTCTVVVTEG